LAAILRTVRRFFSASLRLRDEKDAVAAIFRGVTR
jgi:hypothetical protein